MVAYLYKQVYEEGDRVYTKQTSPGQARDGKASSVMATNKELQAIAAHYEEELAKERQLLQEVVDAWQYLPGGNIEKMSVLVHKIRRHLQET